MNGPPLMEPILVFPEPPPPELAQTLDLAGYSWKGAPTADAPAQPSVGSRRAAASAVGAPFHE